MDSELGLHPGSIPHGKIPFQRYFYGEHFIKDMGIALMEAEKMGLAMPGLALAKQLDLALQAQGYGRKATQTLMLVLESLSSIKR